MFNNHNMSQATRNGNGVIDRDIKGFVVDFIYVIRNLINSSGMIFGSIALHLLDVMLGGIVFSRMLSGYDFTLLGITLTGTTLGWLISLVFWYVQLLLWEYIFQDGKFDRKDIPALVVAISIAVLDTVGDSSSVLIATRSSTLNDTLQGEVLFGYPLFDVLKTVLFYSVMIVTGGNEFINQLLTRNASNDLFKRLKQNTKSVRKNPVKPNSFFRPTPKPVKKP